MARGRILSRKISLNKKIADLYNDCGADGLLWYTWTIAHLDVEGRVHGDPDLMKAQVCPRLSGVTPDVIRNSAAKAFELGLIDLYEVDGDTYISYPKFLQNQVGLRKEKERKSELPPSSGVAPEWCRTKDGVAPDKGRSCDGVTTPEEKRREEKRREYRAQSSELRSDSGQSVLTLQLIPRDGEYGITQHMIDEWSESYPGVDVIAELKKAIQWCRDNPTRRKTKQGARKFLGGWLGRCQDKSKGNGDGNGSSDPDEPEWRFGLTKTELRRRNSLGPAHPDWISPACLDGINDPDDTGDNHGIEADCPDDA